MSDFDVAILVLSVGSVAFTLQLAVLAMLVSCDS
jgi:hypothetical protein